MELSPAYVDLTVTRWQAFTGEEARLEGKGRSFAEMQASGMRSHALPVTQSNVVPFPLCRRQKLVIGLASVLAPKQGDKADIFWKQSAKIILGQLAAAGLASKPLSRRSGVCCTQSCAKFGAARLWSGHTRRTTTIYYLRCRSPGAAAQTGSPMPGPTRPHRPTAPASQEV